MQNNPAKDIDSYIARFPEEIQETLQKVRNTIRQSAPEAEEAISYQIPTFKLGGNLVHFAAFKNHIGFYPGASGIANFKEALSPYKGSKGAVQFPIGKEVPYSLISKIVQFRVKESLGKVVKKLKKV